MIGEDEEKTSDAKEEHDKVIDWAGEMKSLPVRIYA